MQKRILHANMYYVTGCMHLCMFVGGGGGGGGRVGDDCKTHIRDMQC